MSAAGGATLSHTRIDPSELRVTRLRALRGPNYWRLAPVIACDVQCGALETVSSADVPGFTERLVAAIPTLREHPCSRRREGGFIARLQEGTHLPHILEHVALELQTLAGADVSFGRVVESGDPGTWWVIVAYDEEAVGLQAMRDAVTIVRAALAGEEIDAGRIVTELQELYEGVRLGPSTAAIVEEARRRNIPVRRLNSRSLVQLGLGRNLRRIQATITDFTSSIGVEIAQDKDDTKRVLSNIGLPVPGGDVVTTEDGAVEVAKEIGYPVILKPLDASHGRGISPRLDSEADVRRAWPLAKEHGRRIVVEQFAVGNDHRVLVVDGRVVACAERVPAHVKGDGRHTIRELITIENADPRRGVGHSKILTKLPCDHVTEAFLKEHGRTLETIPEPGEVVLLRATANLSTGGTSIDRTEEMHPDNVTACQMAAGAVGLDIAGIDVITPDISVPFRENRAVIIEVNAAPGVRMHTHPSEGKPRNVGAPIIDMLYPPGTEHTIPVIAVTGTNGKTTTTRLVAHLLRQAGHRVGFTSTDGVYAGDAMVFEGDMTGPMAADIVLSNPRNDAAVLETARGGILRAGLGYDACDVGVVLNVTADHLGLRGIHTVEQLADVKAVIISAVRPDGHAVLNADDPLVLAMRRRTDAHIVLFSLLGAAASEPVAEHLRAGGMAVTLEREAGGEALVLHRGAERTLLAPLSEVPLTEGGAARFQVQNAAAASAAAWALGIPPETIRAGLARFVPSAATTPGRMNVLHLRDATIIVDYAHNPAAIRALLDYARRVDADRRIAVLSIPGDRRDADIREMGSLGAEVDRVIFMENPPYRRGRAVGETGKLLVEGLVAAGGDAALSVVVHGQDAAVDEVLRHLRPRDLVLFMADDAAFVTDRLEASTRGGEGVTSNGASGDA